MVGFVKWHISEPSQRQRQTKFEATIVIPRACGYPVRRGACCESVKMPDLADLFPGYASDWINTKSGRIFARVGGKGPPLLLLHGFSETHVQWHRVAPQLADRFTLIIADLPGYGWSDMPESDKDHTPYTKRAMAQTAFLQNRIPSPVPLVCSVYCQT